MKTSIFYCFLIALAVIFSGCAKDGEQGPAGPAGQDGHDGLDGNANVMSLNYTVTPGMWQSSSDQYIYVEIPVSQITQEIVDNGLVMVYFQQDGYSGALPFTFFAGSIPISFLFAYTVGVLEIDLMSTESLNTPTVNYEFKVIIVPSNQIITNPKINWNNYEEVKSAFNL